MNINRINQKHQETIEHNCLPENYERDIFIASKKGKLTSLHRLLEKEKEDKNRR